MESAVEGDAVAGPSDGSGVGSSTADGASGARPAAPPSEPAAGEGEGEGDGGAAAGGGGAAATTPKPQPKPKGKQADEVEAQPTPPSTGPSVFPTVEEGSSEETESEEELA